MKQCILCKINSNLVPNIFVNLRERYLLIVTNGDALFGLLYWISLFYLLAMLWQILKIETRITQDHCSFCYFLTWVWMMQTPIFFTCLFAFGYICYDWSDHNIMLICLRIMIWIIVSLSDMVGKLNLHDNVYTGSVFAMAYPLT